MDKNTSIDSNGYYMGDDLTPEQEQHNLDLDKQIGGSMKDDIMGILLELEETKYELMHVLAGLGGSDYDQSLVVRLNHIVVDLEKLYKKQADHEGVEL